MQTSALPLGYGARIEKAGNETRTRDSHLGKVVLYQLSYSRFDVIAKLDMKYTPTGAIVNFLYALDVTADPADGP